METTDLMVLVVGAMLGFAAAWLARRGSVKREVHARLEARLAAANHRLEAAEGDRLAISGQALELQRALRAERSLLDGVAAQAGIAPHDFRRTLARDVLHRSDPYRARYLDEPIELERSVGQLAEMKLGVRPIVLSSDLGRVEGSRVEGSRVEGRVDLDRVAQLEGLLAEVRSELDRRKSELDQVIEESRAIAGELATTERELDAARESLRRPTEQAGPPIVDDSVHWTHPSRRVASLSEEVATLRARLADRSIESDRLLTRLAQHADVDRLLAYLATELDRLRDDVEHWRFPPPPERFPPPSEE